MLPEPPSNEPNVDPEGQPLTKGKAVGRRVILGMLGLGGLGIVAGARIQDGISSALAPILARDPTGLSSLLPFDGGWRIYTVTGSLPYESDAAWKLQVDGLVERPVTIDYSQLQALPVTKVVRDFQCVTGWRVTRVRWVGVQLSEILRSAGVRPEAKAVVFESFDGAYTESLTLSQAHRSDVIVAYGMEGGAISREHGGPVRLYVAPMYGYKSCKWLKRITVVDQVIPGYWENRGYDVDAWVGGSNGRNDAPTH